MPENYVFMLQRLQRNSINLGLQFVSYFFRIISFLEWMMLWLPDFQEFFDKGVYEIQIAVNSLGLISFTMQCVMEWYMMLMKHSWEKKRW